MQIGVIGLRRMNAGDINVDCGTSDRVFGLERGFCPMIFGGNSIVEHLDPIFSCLPAKAWQG